MANAVLTSNVIAKEMLAVLENELVLAKSANRSIEEEFKGERKVGDTVTVRKPARFTVRDGRVASIQDVTEEGVPVTLDKQKGVDVSFTSKELLLNIQDFSKQVIQPSMASLANQIDLDGFLSIVPQIANQVGTPGTIPNTMKTYALAGAKMSQEAAPLDERSIIMDPMAQVELIDSQKGLFQSATQIKEQYEKGKMGTAAGFDFSMSQNGYIHQVGPLGGTPLINGVTAEGATQLVVDGFTAAAALRLKKGDVFTVDGVFAVNPQSRQTTGSLRQFVVTADVSSNASGQATIPVWPALNATGAKKTVTALPADNAQLTIAGASGAVSPTHLALHKNAIALVSAELPLPGGMDMASRATSKKTGLTIRFVRGYDIVNDQFISRADVLYGWAPLYKELACRIAG